MYVYVSVYTVSSRMFVGERDGIDDSSDLQKTLDFIIMFKF